MPWHILPLWGLRFFSTAMVVILTLSIYGMINALANRSGAPIQYVEQIPALLVFLVVTLPYLFFPINRIPRIAILTLRATAICMLLLLWRAEWHLFTLLGAIAGIETSVSFDRDRAIVLAVPFIILPFVLLSFVDSAWGMEIGGLPLVSVVAAAVAFVLFLLATEKIKRAFEQIPLLESRNQHLASSVDRLIRANQRYMQFAAAADLISAERERNRISRDVHDSMGYTIMNILAIARVIRRTIPTEMVDVCNRALSIEEQAQEGLRQMRAALRALRAANPDRTTGIGAVYNLAKVFEASTGVSVRVEVGGCRWDRGTPVDETIYHLVQEGLTNAFRHGQARNVGLYFANSNNGISVVVEDDGTGPNIVEKGIGLLGLSERAASVGGRVRTESGKTGFRLVAWLPFNQSERTDHIDRITTG